VEHTREEISAAIGSATDEELEAAIVAATTALVDRTLELVAATLDLGGLLQDANGADLADRVECARQAVARRVSSPWYLDAVASALPRAPLTAS
jgi:hypothetical protein